MRVWSAVSGECINVLCGHTGKVYSAALLLAQRGAVTSLSGVFDPVPAASSSKSATRAAGARIGAGVGAGVGSISGKAKGKNKSRPLVSGAWDKTLRVWDQDSGTVLN